MMSMMTQSQLEQFTPLPHCILWIDGVGGYTLIDRQEVTVGQAAAGNRVDVAIVGDLSRQAALIRRIDSDYLLQPLQSPTQLNGRAVDRAQLLRSSDEIVLGQRVRLKFSQPTPLSGTARLELPGWGRFQPRVDGILLLAEACILGPGPGCHVCCPHWNSEVRLVRRDTGWCIRGSGDWEVNGQQPREQISVAPGMRVCGSDFSFSIE